MKKTVIILAMALIAHLLSAQEDKAGSLEVTGTAEKSVEPDQVIFMLNLAVEKESFSETVDLLNENMSKLKDALMSAGLMPDNIRSLNYSVNEKYDYLDGKRIKKGFRGSHGLRVKATFEENKMKEIHEAVTKSNVEVNMSISFGLSNYEMYQDQLIQEALADARRKADVIAMGSNSQLGSIVKVVYGNQNYNRPILMNYNSVAKGRADAGVDINPGNLKLSDEIFVVYELIPQP